MATETKSFVIDAVVIPTPFIYQVYKGVTEDTFKTLQFEKQSKKIRITVTDNPITIQGAYGNQSGYTYNMMFEDSIDLPVGTDWTMNTGLRGMKLKSKNSGSAGTYDITVWFYPSVA